MKRLFFRLAMLLSFFFVPFVSADEPSIIEILKKVAEEKDSIQSGEFEVVSRFEGDYVGWQNWTRHLHFYFDGKQERFDCKKGERVIVNLLNCPKEGDFALFISRPNGPLPEVPDIVKHLKEPILAKLELFPEDQRWADPPNTIDRVFPVAKVIGSMPKPVVGMRHRDSKLLNFLGAFLFLLERQKEGKLHEDNTIRVSEEMFGGQLCVKILMTSDVSLETARKAKTAASKDAATLWLAVDKGHSLVGNDFVSELNLNGAPLHIESSMRTEVQWCEDGKQWFPAKWTYTEKRNGKTTATEKNELKIISMNKPIRPSVFTLQGISEMKEMTPVFWNLPEPPPAEGDLVWDGKKITSNREAVEATLYDPVRSRRQRMILLVNVSLVSLLLMSLSWKYFRKKTAK